ncbi:hypothetical protein LJC48_04160 [Desulfovibrio sp. OttesenSCG-928-C06]|nr:hypothetical protein [Desulfovibrio sp. OttesenSCG-928-C06]
MIIRLKYCGGCNPRYDRTALAARLGRDLPGARLTHEGEGEFDVVAVLCGCPARCAGHEELRGRLGKIVLADERDYTALLKLCGVAE